MYDRHPNYHFPRFDPHQHSGDRLRQQEGDLHLAAAGLSWLAIQKAIADLQQPCATQDGRMLRSGPKESCRGAKEAVMKAMKSLGGKVATSKQVKDYLEEHPEALPNMSAAERQRSIRGLRLWQVCELHSKNKYGEDVFAIPAEALPTGVRRHKDYFTARTKLECLNTICIGPSRATAEEAKTDYDTMRQWLKTMSYEAVVQRVHSWDGAHVTKCRVSVRSSRAKERMRSAFRKVAFTTTVSCFGLSRGRVSLFTEQ